MIATAANLAQACWSIHPQGDGSRWRPRSRFGSVAPGRGNTVAVTAADVRELQKFLHAHGDPKTDRLSHLETCQCA